MYLHHEYKYYVSFKCNDKKCNHTLKQIRPRAIDDPSSENLFCKTIFSGHRFSVNTISANGLSGIKESIDVAFPKTEYQRIVHQVRNTLKHVSYKDKRAIRLVIG